MARCSDPDYPAGVTVLAVHGIGNQKRGATATLVRRALMATISNRDSLPPEIEVDEFHWAEEPHRVGGVMFLRWCALNIPLLILLATSSDERDRLRTQTLWQKRPLALLALALTIYAVLGAEVAVAMTFLAILAGASTSRRRLVARFGMIVIPVSWAIYYGGIWVLPSLLLVTVLALLIVGQRNFLASLPATETAALPLQRLRGNIDALTGTGAKLVIVAHSMGAYLVLQALRLQESAGHSGHVLVIALGSGARTLSVLEEAKRHKKSYTIAWLFLLGTALSTAGASVALLLLFIAVDRTSHVAETAFDKWLLWQDPENWTPLAEWLQGSPIAANMLSLLVLAPGVAGMSMYLGYRLAAAANDSLRRLLVRCEAPLPTSIDWIDCCSVHDSVGRGIWPQVPRMTVLPVSGSGFALVDHPLSRYLKSGSVALQILALALDNTRIPSDSIRLRSRVEIEKSQDLDDQRDAVFAGLFGALLLSGVTASFRSLSPSNVLSEIVMLMPFVFLATLCYRVFLRIRFKGATTKSMRGWRTRDRSRYRIAAATLLVCAPLPVTLVVFWATSSPYANLVDQEPYWLDRGLTSLGSMPGGDLGQLFLLAAALYLQFAIFQHVATLLFGLTLSTPSIVMTLAAAGVWTCVLILILYSSGAPTEAYLIFILPIWLGVTGAMFAMHWIRGRYGRHS